MSITEITQYSNDLACAVELSVGPKSLRFSAGTVRVAQQTFEIPEATEFTITPCEQAATLRVFVVKRRGTAEVALLVDECVHDGVDRPYVFSGSPFEPLHMLAFGVLPAKSIDATKGEWKVFRLEPLPKEERLAGRTAPQAVDPAELQRLLMQRGMQS